MTQVRRQRLWQLGAVTVFAAILVVVTIVVSQSGSSSLQHLDEDRAAVVRLFDGIPQHGLTLGDPRAQATLLEFADLQCPFCRSFTLDELPSIVERYVKPGKLALRFEPQTIIGPQSDDAALAALAAARQDRLWQFADLFYRNQDDENSGYVTSDFVQTLFVNTPGLDARLAVTEQRSTAVADALTKSRDQFGHFGLSTTPSFVLTQPGQGPQTLSASELQAKLSELRP